MAGARGVGDLIALVRYEVDQEIVEAKYRDTILEAGASIIGPLVSALLDSASPQEAENVTRGLSFFNADAAAVLLDALANTPDSVAVERLANAIAVLGHQAGGTAGGLLAALAKSHNDRARSALAKALCEVSPSIIRTTRDSAELVLSAFRASRDLDAKCALGRLLARMIVIEWEYDRQVSHDCSLPVAEALAQSATDAELLCYAQALGSDGAFSEAELFVLALRVARSERTQRQIGAILGVASLDAGDLVASLSRENSEWRRALNAMLLGSAEETAHASVQDIIAAYDRAGVDYRTYYLKAFGCLAAAARPAAGRVLELLSGARQDDRGPGGGVVELALRVLWRMLREGPPTTLLDEKLHDLVAIYNRFRQHDELHPVCRYGAYVIACALRPPASAGPILSAWANQQPSSERSILLAGNHLSAPTLLLPGEARFEQERAQSVPALLLQALRRLPA